jgi:ribosomal protein S1
MANNGIFENQIPEIFNNQENNDLVNQDNTAQIIENPVSDASAEVAEVNETPATETIVSDIPISEPPVSEPQISETDVSDITIAEPPVSEPQISETIVTDTQPAESETTDERLSVAVEKTVEHHTKRNSGRKSAQMKSGNEMSDKLFDDIFKELAEIKQNNGSIEVIVQSRIRGGLRVAHKDMPMFLPASHFSNKRNPSEESLQESIGKSFRVIIHEMQEDETHRKTVVVSRKQILEDDFWNSIKAGDVVEGAVSSIASFGIFIDLGGAEGLVHISRLSQVHIDDPRTYCKKGDVLKAVVVEVDKGRKRIALSRKELESSPWKGVSDEFPQGSRIKGFVRRMTDFGAYIEIRTSIDGLLRNNELSWTKRFRNVSDILSINQEIELEVLSVNEEKQSMSLSLKRTQENPWKELAAKYPVNLKTTGKIKQIVSQGCVIDVNGEVDGFMPRSKMKNLLKGKKVPYNVGDEIEVIIADIEPDKESLILAPLVIEEEPIIQKPMQKENKENRDNRDNRDNKERSPKEPRFKEVENDSGSNSFTLGDLLSESMKKSLMNQ